MCFEHIHSPILLLTPPRSIISIPSNFVSSFLNFNIYIIHTHSWVQGYPLAHAISYLKDLVCPYMTHIDPQEHTVWIVGIEPHSMARQPV